MTGGEIIYEVVITVAPETRADYLDWLAAHTDEMLGFDGFLNAEIAVNSEDDREITCLYTVASQTAMDAYLAGPAARMRADGVARFGDKISARRRILLKL